MGIYFQQQITPQLPPLSHHFVVLSVSSVPIHGHNSGSGSLNIEGNSIWPCFSLRTCSVRASSHINLTEDQILLGHASLVVMRLPSSHCSYRVTGCQSLCPFELRALIDSELGMFGVLCTGMCRAEIKRWQSAHRCCRTLTLQGVGGRRGVDLRQGGVAAAGDGLLGGASLRKRRKEESAIQTRYQTSEV